MLLEKNREIAPEGMKRLNQSGELIVVASLVAEHGSRVSGLSSCCSSAVEHRLNSYGTWA